MKNEIYLLTNEEMKSAEKEGMDMGIPSMILMENAAMNVTREVLKQNPKSVVVISGKGNNGGDGLAVARQLVANGTETKVIFVGERERATPDCKTNLDILLNIEKNTDLLSVKFTDKDQSIELLWMPVVLCDVIVDALTGTGIKGKLSDYYAELVKLINRSGKYVVSVDCPTGINTDTGEDYGIAVNANKTVTFHYPKIGMMLYPAYGHLGELVTGNIGMPYTEGGTAFILTENGAKALLPKRYQNSHKGSYGKVVVVAGCDYMTGAAVFNTKAAYKTGCGLVQICSVKRCVTVVQNSVPEVVTTVLKNKEGYISCFDECVAEGASSLAIGSGMGCTKNGVEVVTNALAIDIPTVVDADALNIISKYDLRDMLKNKTITPHIKEMSRLCGKSTEEIISNPVATAVDFAKKYGCIVVLKSAHTVIADMCGRVCINTTGCSSMSKGGSGDCLTGIIASLTAQGLDEFNSAVLGTYINGKAGEVSAKHHGEYGATASDLIEGIEEVLMNLSGK